MNRATVLRGLVASGLALVLALSTVGMGLAVPPPPGNPSDSDISAGQSQVKDKAAQVGDLTNQLAAADARLTQLQSQVEQKMEEVNKALVDLQAAQEAARKAQDAASAAKVEATAAGDAVDLARHQLDEFAAASLQQGSAVGSVSALIDANDPKDLIDRAQLLSDISRSQLRAMDVMQRANVDKANKESASRKALDLAKQKQDEAAIAKKRVDSAMAAAVAARQSQAEQTKQLQSAKTEVENQLAAAQDKVSDLQAQRQRYQDWQEQKRREDEAAAQAAAQAAAARPSGGGGGGAPAPRPVAAPSGSRANIVVQRAMAQLGITYAWGGGTPSGPSRGISDGGGDADYFGDYNRIGFDCSGLMVYAFAGVGIYLPHYSGYQYYAGQHVPLSQMAPGDMLFYGNPSNIHHVTMYVGGGQMIEAPYSGGVVRVVPVRWGEIMPYATRML
ncbi:NlpC/P60 family protein [Kutzneria albida]|uniref:NlpC/P60 domain-containing protein n=1 Tax=Kutzneria albida DSM 43870 TaxID=1449976 RepID=W5W6F4_9PSEU|nr:NlpC/P60 family protein [Kutzneria albida]AHH96345.1 hypothetical protein KALB_2977 [Kutzneria albida DSM 43870]